MRLQCVTTLLQNHAIGKTHLSSTRFTPTLINPDRIAFEYTGECNYVPVQLGIDLFGKLRHLMFFLVLPRFDHRMYSIHGDYMAVTRIIQEP